MKKNRLLSILLVLVMVLTLLPLSAAPVYAGPEPNPKYTLTVDDTHLSLEGHETSFEADRDVKIKVTSLPDGKVFDHFTFTDTDTGDEITVSVTQEGDKYKFKMPAANTTVKGVYRDPKVTLNLELHTGTSDEATGTVSFDPANVTESVAADQTIKVYCSPGTYCTVEKVEADAKPGGKLTVNAVGDHWEFTTPSAAADVTVKVKMKRLPAQKITFSAMSNGSVTVSNAQHGTLVEQDGGAAENKFKARPGATVNLAINPAANYALKSLTITPATGDPVQATIAADGLSASFTMPNSAVTIGAIFDTAYSITYNPDDGSVTGPAKSVAGVTVSLSVSPPSGSVLESITAVPATVSIDSDLSFTMPADPVTVTAAFSPVLSVSVASVSSEIFKLGTPGETTSTTITATPTGGNGSNSYKWYDGEDEITGETSASYTFSSSALGDHVIKCVVTSGSQTASDTVTVKVKEKIYDVTVSNDGNGTGSATPASGAESTEVTLSATPSAGYQFKEWQVVSGGVTVTNNKFTIGTSNVEVKAIFEEIYTVTVSNDGNGTGSATPASGIAGTEVTLSATPSAGYQFKEWQVVSGGVTVTNNKFNIGTSNVEVKAIFEEIYDVTVSNDGNGTGSADPDKGISGTEVTLSATANPGYQFKEWQVVSGGVTVANNKFNISSSDVEVKAVFEEIYTVTVTDDGNGTGKAEPASGIAGTEVTLSATPKDGYVFKEWKVVSGGVTVANNKFTIGAADVEVKAIFEKKAAYTVAQGAGGTWTKGSAKDFTFKITRDPDNDACFDHFSTVKIDDMEVLLSEREVKSGSVIVTIKASRLQKLSIGYHTIEVVFDDGSVKTELKVEPNPDSPATGDSRTTALWAALTVLTALGMGVVAALPKKRRSSKR